MTSRKNLNNIPLHRTYHENSKNLEIDPVDKSEAPQDWFEVEYKTYDRGEKIDLPCPDPVETVPLERTIDTRRSPVTFEPTSIGRETLGRLLARTAGITERGETDDDHLRAYPSGGARYPLELYTTVLRAKQVETGVYHYDVRQNALNKTPQDDVHEFSEFVYGSLENAVMLVFVTADLERTTKKYGERGYRYANLEAGHAMQNLCLVSESVGLGCRPYGGFLEDQADEYLCLHGNETTLYVGAVGRPATASQHDNNEDESR
ncbi:SagB/ThcOx family dehydrogenase [Haloarcula brevis]|uniref:SagB/ThcOx family dehydrogenase n=1 Tax=Haloarcula brevis TaxID=3111453 RepID=UPI00300F7237